MTLTGVAHENSDGCKENLRLQRHMRAYLATPSWQPYTPLQFYFSICQPPNLCVLLLLDPPTLQNHMAQDGRPGCESEQGNPGLTIPWYSSLLSFSAHRACWPVGPHWMRISLRVRPAGESTAPDIGMAWRADVLRNGNHLDGSILIGSKPLAHSAEECVRVEAEG